MESFFRFIQSKHLSFIFLQQQVDKDDQDENVLIDSKQKCHSANNKHWRNLCYLLDKVSIFVLSALYLILCLTLVPFRYGINNNPIKIMS